MTPRELATRARERAAGERESAARIDAGELSSNWTSAEYRAHADRLDALADRADPKRRPRPRPRRS